MRYLMKTGELGKARKELMGAEELARDDRADFEAALTLTALEGLDELEGGSPNTKRIEERDRILEPFGVVRLPELEKMETAGRATHVALP